MAEIDSNSKRGTKQLGYRAHIEMITQFIGSADTREATYESFLLEGSDTPGIIQEKFEEWERKMRAHLEQIGQELVKCAIVEFIQDGENSQLFTDV